MEVTESMQPYIDTIEQNMVTFAHDLAANNCDYRLGQVTFEDYVVSKYPDCNCPYRNKMTSNVNEFINWVGRWCRSIGGKSSWHEPSTSEQLTMQLLTPPAFVN